MLSAFEDKRRNEGKTRTSSFTHTSSDPPPKEQVAVQQPVTMNDINQPIPKKSSYVGTSVAASQAPVNRDPSKNAFAALKKTTHVEAALSKKKQKAPQNNSPAHIPLQHTASVFSDKRTSKDGSIEYRCLVNPGGLLEWVCCIYFCCLTID